jgi:hypothetical protein
MLPAMAFFRGKSTYFPLSCPVTSRNRQNRRFEIMESKEIPLNQRYALTVKEARQYFHIGEKRLRWIAAEHPGAEFLVWNGRKVLIIREEFEKFLRQTSCI